MIGRRNLSRSPVSTRLSIKIEPSGARQVTPAAFTISAAWSSLIPPSLSAPQPQARAGLGEGGRYNIAKPAEAVSGLPRRSQPRDRERQRFPAADRTAAVVVLGEV